MSSAQHPSPEADIRPVRMDRSLPPAMALLKCLAEFGTRSAEARPDMARHLLGLREPLPDEDRPLLKEWLVQWMDRRALETQEMRVELDALGRRCAEADALHRTVERQCGLPGRQRRLLEQELLLRSTLPEDWHFHRAKWRYLELQADQAGNLLSPTEASRRARQAGIFFHPDQLKPNRLLRWFNLRQAAELLEGQVWLDLLGHLCAGRPVDLALAPELWPHLRPWLHHLLGGQGQGLMELSMNSLPEQPGKAPGNRGLLVLHSADDAPAGLEEWCRGAAQAGWQVLAIQAPQRPPLAWANFVDGSSLGAQWAQRHRLSTPALQGRPLPLRDFLRGVERHYILDVLGVTGGIKTKACECLGISRQTLYAKLGTGEVDA